MSASYWIKNLGLLPHPEGGFFKETYRCQDQIKVQGSEAMRNISTAIYFLLEDKNKSHFHRIKSDELWFHHEGNALEILLLDSSELKIISLGKGLEKGESLQAIIPAGKWFAARVKDGKGFALVSCTVAPGFDFQDFELADLNDLLKEYPRYEKDIREMTLKK